MENFAGRRRYGEPGRLIEKQMFGKICYMLTRRTLQSIMLSRPEFWTVL